MKKWAARFVACGLLFVIGCEAGSDADDSHTDMEVFQISDAPNLPFSSAVRAGDILFLSGQIGNVPGTLDLAEGGVAAETQQTLDNRPQRTHVRSLMV